MLCSLLIIERRKSLRTIEPKREVKIKEKIKLCSRIMKELILVTISLKDIIEFMKEMDSHHVEEAVEVAEEITAAVKVTMIELIEADEVVEVEVIDLKLLQQTVDRIIIPTQAVINKSKTLIQMRKDSLKLQPF